MLPTQRVVTATPLTELWTEDGVLSVERLGFLSPAEVRALLLRGAVRFVIAKVGRPLNWVSEKETHVFWKGEARPHVVDPTRPFDIFEYPEGYVYLASEWTTGELGAVPIVLLERHQ